MSLFLSSPSVGKYRAKVSPVVLLTILDHYTRRNEDQTRVIGTLLGIINENGEVEIRNCFPVPHNETDEVSVDAEFHNSMLELYHKVNPKEVIVGWYATGESVDQFSTLVHDFFTKEVKSQGKEVTLPIHLVVNTSLKDGKLDIKTYSSSNIGVVEEPQGIMFIETPCEILQTNAERIGMQAISQARHSPESKTNILSDIDNLELAIQRLQQMLDRVTTYVDSVLDGKTVADPVIGRYLMDIITSVPKIDKEQFEQSFNNNIQDLLMVVYLANMTRAQLAVAEKLQAVVIE